MQDTIAANAAHANTRLHQAADATATAAHSAKIRAESFMEHKAVESQQRRAERQNDKTEQMAVVASLDPPPPQPASSSSSAPSVHRKVPSRREADGYGELEERPAYSDI